MLQVVFSIHEPSPTIRGVNRPMPKGYKKHEGDPVKSLEGIRALTTKERSLIQTFPEDFNFSGCKTNIEQMIGNAVPVNLGKFVAESIRNYAHISAADIIHKYDFDAVEPSIRFVFDGSEPYLPKTNQ